MRFIEFFDSFLIYSLSSPFFTFHLFFPSYGEDMWEIKHFKLSKILMIRDNTSGLWKLLLMNYRNTVSKKCYLKFFPQWIYKTRIMIKNIFLILFMMKHQSIFMYNYNVLLCIIIMYYYFKTIYIYMVF